jgi:hypothetical protein
VNAEPAPAEGRRRPNRRCVVSHAAGTSTVPLADGDVIVIAIDEFQERVRDWAALREIGAMTLRAPDPRAFVEELRAGRLPVDRRPRAAPRNVSNLHAAIATALVAYAKKAGAQMERADPLAKVAAMTRQQREAYRTDPKVAAELAKLTGAPSLAALVGV